MDWGLLGSPKWMNVLPPPPHLLSFSSSSSPPPPPPSPSLVLPSNLDNKINPSIFLIIVMLAVIFFVSGLLHLLARCLLRPTDRDPEDPGSATAMQGQLQQLFHLHDSGVDQSFIDTLPLFLYKAIIGLKSPFDCAVCLCEFEPDDKLRLLPKCSHAFHMECIDTWLLSHSTCPLCRGSLLADFSPACSPVVFLLESASESLRETGSERGDSWPNVQLGSIEDDVQRPGDVEAKVDAGSTALEVSKAKVVAVKLGKFRNVDAAVNGGEGTSSGTGSSNLNDRRCFSMGSFEYVMDETTMLQVPIKPTKKKSPVVVPGHRLTMSECDCHSTRHGFKEFNPSRISESEGYCGSSSINPNKRESFSISKIWLRSNKDKPLGAEDCSRRASSFQISVHRGASDESSKVKGSTSSRRTVSEFDFAGWMKHGNELGSDVDIGSCNGSIASRAEETPSFARRTLLWIAGRQNKVVNHV